jgi:putative SOS response-associated peptidase YedK
VSPEMKTGALGTTWLPLNRSPSFASIRRSRDLSLVRWALVPWWARDASGSAQRINARSETAATKAAFGDALKSKRCIVPADGFYEWKKTRTGKQPYCFEVNNGELFAFAGCGIAGRSWTARPQRRGSITDDYAERRNIRCPRPGARNP